MHKLDCRLRSLLATCLLTGSLIAPLDAAAAGVSPMDASVDQKKSATEHFIAGKQAFESKNWDQAIAELRASLEVVDSPNAHLELARALRDSGKPSDAWIEYGRAIETATQFAPKEERYAKTADAATTERGEVEGRLAFVLVTVAHAPPNASLTVGGRVIPSEDWTAPLIVAPGEVDVVLTASGGAELARQTASASIGRTTPVSLDGSVATGGAATGPVDESEEDKPPSDGLKLPSEPIATRPSVPTKMRPYAYAAGGIGVAGLAAFTVFGLMSNSTYSDLKNSCTHGCPPDKRGEIDSGITQQTVANVGLAVGLVGLAAGATIFVLSMPHSQSSGSAALVVGPGYLGIRGHL
jgi:hypothetical protein